MSAAEEAATTAEVHRQRMQRRKEVQDQRVGERRIEKGLVIVTTGHGKGKTTAALGLVLRSLGHGEQVAVVQFIKGAWQPGEALALQRFGEQIHWHALGGSPGRPRIASATSSWWSWPGSRRSVTCAIQPSIW